MAVSISVKDKVVIVTGGGQGIGKAYAEALAADGAKVVVAEINAENAAAVAKAIKGSGGEAIAVQTDVAKIDSAQNMAKATLDKYGRIDALVNNAAVYYGLKPAPFWDLDEADWDRVMSVNVKGIWNCCKAVIPQMIKQGKGKVINVSSTTAFIGAPFTLHYVASKGAVIAMTRSLCKEMALLAPEGEITVNAIAPGLTFSEATLSIIGSPEMAQPYLQQQTLKRQEVPADLAGAVLYLCSDASDFMSGHIMVVDGGVSLY